MAKKEFTNKQMLEIKKGIKNGIDTSVYNNVDYNAEQMREIRLGMEQGWMYQNIWIRNLINTK